MLKNLIVNLSATGVVAALCILAMCMTAVGIWGEGVMASSALTGLLFIAGGLLFQVRRQ